MVGSPRVAKRQVVKLEATKLNHTGKLFLSIVQCEMKDIKKGDLFIMLESSLELVLGKDNKFLWKAKMNAVPYKDTYTVQAEEI